MRTFERIVFVSQAVTDDFDALKQALTIAHSNNATLSALIACPEFPPQQAQYRERYESSLAQHLDDSIQAAREATGISAARLPVAIEVEGGSMPAVRIIRHVLQYGFDLVMGTVARTGIPGFVIGNTAENIFRQLDCTLLAAKPAGFDSPITIS